MKEKYIYCLVEDTFKSKQDYIDMYPTDNAFYFGHTCNPKKRKLIHRYKAQYGSTYSHHQKIRKLGKDGWDIEVIGCVKDHSLTKDVKEVHIEYYRRQGHTPLNRDCSDWIQRLPNSFFEKYENKRSHENDEHIEAEVRHQRGKLIEERMLNQIEKKHTHVQYDSKTENHCYDYNGQTIKAKKGAQRKEIVQMIFEQIKYE
ncbi:MAG: hypothetical protein RPU61_17225 [Candidatus Sedimenticola sp. (ex Thyasira tokunagai)]